MTFPCSFFSPYWATLTLPIQTLFHPPPPGLQPCSFLSLYWAIATLSVLFYFSCFGAPSKFHNSSRPPWLLPVHSQNFPMDETFYQSLVLILTFWLLRPPLSCGDEQLGPHFGLPDLGDTGSYRLQGHSTSPFSSMGTLSFLPSFLWVAS